jgi:iron complex transport system ATP-binding protein
MSFSSQISIQDASFGYGSKVILKDITLDLEKESIHCIFGRNGSGKTTFLKSLSAHIPLLGGHIYFDDENLFKITAKKRAAMMASVFTGRPLIGNMRVADFVAYGRYPYTNWLGIQQDTDSKRVEEVMEKCGVSGLSKGFLSELSDGEMQKVQISRALAQDSPVLLFDEPVAHLDLVNKAEIFNLLKQISRTEKKTILFTSHDIQFALQLSDTFLVVENNGIQKLDAMSFKIDKTYERILKSEYLDFDAANNALNFKSSN